MCSNVFLKQNVEITKQGAIWWVLIKAGLN